MERPTVINVKTVRAAGGPKPDVYIGRPMKWGNPFHIGKDGNRFEVCEKYREWIKTQPRLMSLLPTLAGKPPPAVIVTRFLVMATLFWLRWSRRCRNLFTRLTRPLSTPRSWLSERLVSYVL